MFAVRQGSACESTVSSSSFFFFQAEDGIRDLTVTGVQTCALPICSPHLCCGTIRWWRRHLERDHAKTEPLRGGYSSVWGRRSFGSLPHRQYADLRSEERRVGKECRSRWSPYH